MLPDLDSRAACRWMTRPLAGKASADSLVQCRLWLIEDGSAEIADPVDAVRARNAQLSEPGR